MTAPIVATSDAAEAGGEILILTTSTGAGHDSVAGALKEAFAERYPAVSVRIVDPLSGGRTRSAMTRAYDAMIEYAPWLWTVIYRATNVEWRIRIGMLLGSWLWADQLREVLDRRRPGMVVSVHPLCTRLAARTLSKMPNAPSLHCVVTDLATIHRCWASPAVDVYCVATREASDALRALGVESERIHVTGLPLRSSFARTSSGHTAGAAPRVLLLGGGRPTSRLARVAKALARSGTPLELTVVCGRNTRLRQRLSRALGDRVTLLGWRDDVADLMRWSSVVVTRGGPTTVAEALSLARPVLIYQALKEQEIGNVMLAERMGSGRYLPQTDEIVAAIADTPIRREGTEFAPSAWLKGAARRTAGRLMAASESTPAAAESAVGSSLPSGLGGELVGREIHNPVSGERIVVRQSGAQTGGALLSFDLYLPVAAHVPARHVHPGQEERFTVLEGTMAFRLGWGRKILAGPGEMVVVPAGTAHWFGNAGDSISHALVEVRPALRLQEVFERSAAMDVREWVPGLRLPGLSELATFMLEFQPELAVPEVPRFLVKAVLTPLAWLGRRRASVAGPPSVS